MTNAVFYSVCPYGTGTMETGAGTIEITSGVATLSVAQTDNIGVGLCIEYNSLECWIAPNRIAFTSGGTTELIVGTKIAGGTSGATGIIRAIEVTSGTWGAGTAAGWIYFEATTGTWNSSEQINRTKPTSSTNIATTNGSLEGNIGNGNTEFVVKNATGGAAANQTSTSVTSVHHEWASLADFETYFTDGSHIGNVSLVTADVVAYACCYYDHANPTTNPDDNAVTIDFGTTGANNYLQVYTPVEGAESINSQRHDGKYDTGAYRIEVSALVPITISEDYVRIDGMQAYRSGTGNNQAIRFNNALDCYLSNSISRKDSAVGYANIYCSDDGTTDLKIWNTVMYGGSEKGLLLKGSVAYIYNCTIFDVGGIGISEYYSSITINCTNTVIFNTTGACWASTSSTINNNYCLSDDATADDFNGANNIVNTTIDATNDIVSLTAGSEDAHIKNTGSDLYDTGTPLFSNGIWRDIDGDERGSSWDIGADEYVSAGPSISIPVIMHHYMQQRL